MNPKEFTPDLIIAAGHPLFNHSTAYLNGEKIEQCFEARISWASLAEPSFGEVVLRSGDSVLFRMPGLGEFDYAGCWAKLACGKVLIEIDETGKVILEKLMQR